MKRIFSAILACLFVFSCVPAFADSFHPSSISTPYVCLMDANTGAVLYEKSAYTKAYPASTTKVMTCILAIELAEDLKEIVTVGESVETRGSTINIVRREEMALIDMLYGLMLRSGNDAAKAIAEHLAGTESEFASLMNAKAAELGMTATHFVKSNGLHNDNHYTTAYDMALLCRYAMQNPTFRKIVATKEHHVEPTNKDSDGYDWINSNRLITTPEKKEDLTYRYATGIKTGDTAQAGRCLVASAEKDGVELVLVLFGDYENDVASEYRFKNSAKIFDWAFENYDSMSVAELSLEDSFQLPVNGANLKTDAEGGRLTLNIALEGLRISGTKENLAALRANPDGIESSYVLNKELTAPIFQGEELGTIYYKYDGDPLFEAKLIASRTVFEASSEVTPVESSPTSSPLTFIEAEPGNGSDDGGRSFAWIFWTLLLLVLLFLLLFVRAILQRKRRKRRAKRRRKSASYRVYRG